LLCEAIRLPLRRSRRLGGLLTFYRPRDESIQPLDDLFTPFVWSPGDFRRLPFEELAEVLVDDQRPDLFIGGYADKTNRYLTLVRGDLRRLSVPFAMFLSSDREPLPDFERLEITDCGNTIRLGEYEAAADAILYEADREFRRTLLAKRRKDEKTFGACLRRLRLTKGLRQSEFGEVTAKTIARLEHGETAAPQGRTLEVISKRLAVDPDEIVEY
jgi:DNA-binding Xre family transcriptional regulator